MRTMMAAVVGASGMGNVSERCCELVPCTHETSWMGVCFSQGLTGPPLPSSASKISDWDDWPVVGRMGEGNNSRKFMLAEPIRCCSDP